MTFRFALSLAAAAALALSGCAPKKEKAPPPKVSSADGAVAAEATSASVATAGVAGSGAKLADANAPKAPAWKLKDLNGNEVSSEQLKGKVVVLDFWATWCGPCRQEIPGYVELQKKYADKGLVIVGASVDAQGPGVVKTFAKKYGVDYTLVMADDATTDAFGGVDAIPTTFLIDREGRIRDRKVGAEETATYEEKIRQVLE